MGTNPTKAMDNIYCRCRKEAGKYNDKLNSREGAAELLGVSVSHAYKIMRELNAELERRGKITNAGRVSRRYLEERLYC